VEEGGATPCMRPSGSGGAHRTGGRVTPAAVEGGGGGAELGVVVGGGGGTIAISDHRRGGEQLPPRPRAGAGCRRWTGRQQAASRRIRSGDIEGRTRDTRRRGHTLRHHATRHALGWSNSKGSPTRPHQSSHNHTTLGTAETDPLRAA
jgi:hypothetical protein